MDEQKEFFEEKKLIEDEFVDFKKGTDQRQEQETEPLQELLKKSTDEILKRFDQLMMKFDSRLSYDKTKEGIIDKLHTRLTEYEKDMQRKIVEPVFKDIILLIDEYKKNAKFFKEKETEAIDKQKLLNHLEGVAEDLENLLYRYTVETIKNDIDLYDPQKQTIGKIEETSEKEKDKKVAETLNSGYEWDGRVIKKETVKVYVYKKPVQNEMNEKKTKVDEDETKNDTEERGKTNV